MNLADLRRSLAFVSQRWRAYDPKLKRSRLRGPLTVQVQTVEGCNGACIMCPAAASKDTPPGALISDSLYTRILEQLRDVDSVMAFVPMLQNEPLLDPHLVRRIREAKETLNRRARIMLVTNGSLLTRDRIDELVESGVDDIEVSLDALDEKTYRTVRKGLDFATVTQNVRHLIAQRAIRPAQASGRPQVHVRFLRQKANANEEAEFCRYWRSQGANVRIMLMTNRAGALKGYGKLRRFGGGTLRSRVVRLMSKRWACLHGPFTTLNVLRDGRTVVCCNDWGPGEGMGNLAEQSLAEAWNSEPMNRHRDLLHFRRFNESPVCRSCSSVRH